MSEIIRENENVGERIVEFCREMADFDRGIFCNASSVT